VSQERENTPQKRGRPFSAGNPGRPKGAKNKKTIILERVYQRCAAQDFHPADVLMEIAMDPKVPVAMRRDCAKDLLPYFEGHQPESKPHSPNTPEDSVAAAKATMEKLTSFAKPLDPKPEPEAAK
jgi:hypothetical protein